MEVFVEVQPVIVRKRMEELNAAVEAQVQDQQQTEQSPQ